MDAMIARLGVLISCLALLGACGKGSGGAKGGGGDASSPDAADKGGSGGSLGLAADTGGGSGGSGTTTVSTGGTGAGGAGGSYDVGGPVALDGQSDVPIGGTAGADVAIGTIATGGSAGTGGIARTGGTTGAGGAASTGGSASTGGTTGTGGAASTVGTTGAGGAASTGGSASTGGTTNTGGATSAGGATGTGPIPVDAGCGMLTSGTSRMAADVLLVLDRSGSMVNSISADTACTGVLGCTARWPALTSAVQENLISTAGSINWGLKLYSSTGTGCGVNAGVEVPISAASVPVINSQIAAVSPAGNTPTEQVITAATAYLQTVHDQNPKYILLATDGEPNCAQGIASAPNIAATVAAIVAAKSAGFPVYVIGIGPSVGNLDTFAMAGGTISYYPASSPQELSSALAAISHVVSTCTFVLAQMPPLPNSMAVYLDRNLVAKDDANGWSFGGNTQTIVLTGTSCDAITAGTATQVQVLFGCPGVQPPPVLY
jgi:Mg-chelatase subunit ChlD